MSVVQSPQLEYALETVPSLVTFQLITLLEVRFRLKERMFSAAISKTQVGQKKHFQRMDGFALAM
jgi:hypothetical protein